MGGGMKDTLAKIEARHAESQAGYDYDKEASGSPFTACGPPAHQDRAQLIGWVKRLLPYASSLQVRDGEFQTVTLNALLREIEGHTP